MSESLDVTVGDGKSNVRKPARDHFTALTVGDGKSNVRKPTVGDGV